MPKRTDSAEPVARTVVLPRRHYWILILLGVASLGAGLSYGALFQYLDFQEEAKANQAAVNYQACSRDNFELRLKLVATQDYLQAINRDLSDADQTITKLKHARHAWLRTQHAATAKTHP